MTKLTTCDASGQITVFTMTDNEQFVEEMINNRWAILIFFLFNGVYSLESQVWLWDALGTRKAPELRLDTLMEILLLGQSKARD